MALQSFRTPAKITDESVDRFLKQSQNITDSIAATGRQIAENVRQEKADQEKRNAERDLEMQQMYDKANQFGSTGDAKLDENILSFWDGKVDDYFQIKNAMQTGAISKQEGNLALARINGLVNQFKTQAKYLAEQSSQYREDFNNGNVSSTSSQQSQNILGAMAKGGNVQITERGGTLYYYLPGEDGSVPNEGNLLNGQQLIANANQEQDLYQTIPDFTNIEQSAYNNTIKPNDMNSDYIELKHVNKGGYKFSYATFNEDKRNTAAEDMVNNGSFKAAIQNESKMKSYYQDVIPDDFLVANGLDADSAWHEYDDTKTEEENAEIQAKQDKVAQLYMANEAMDKFSIPPGGQKFFSKEKIQKDPPKSNKGNPYQYGKGVGDQINTMGTLYDDTIEIADTLYADPQKPPTADQVLASIQDNPNIDETEHDFYMGDGTEEGGKAGVIYHNGTPVSLGKFKSKEGYENYILGLEGMKSETIGYFRKNKGGKKSHTFNSVQEYNDAVAKGTVSSGDTVTIVGANPPTIIQP